jgi:alpha-L-rhamnosidase
VRHELDAAAFARGGADGTHVFGALLGNGMYHVPRVHGRYTKFVGSFGPRALIFAARIVFADGASLDVRTGDAGVVWLAEPRGGPLTASLTYGGEDFDARLWPVGWDAPATPPFDPVAAGWVPAVPWRGPGCALIEQTLEPIVVQRTMPTVATHRVEPSGDRVHDLGRNFMGWPCVVVWGARGARVQLWPGELLNATDGQPIQDGSPNYFNYTLRGSTPDAPERWRPRFSFYGFRWVLVYAVGAPAAPHAPPTIVDVYGEQLFTNATRAGNFSSSVPILNAIHAIVMQSLEGNFASVYFDWYVLGIARV